jgi:Holliday junction resolvasome RuvABC ATP-dependent DNA helicase subunit
MKAFDHLVGQEEVKRVLSFYFEGWKHSNRSPFLLLNGAKGLGKTEFAKAFAAGQKETDKRRGVSRKFIELNCSSFKKVDQFFEQIFVPFLQDGHVTILFDEAHMLPNPLVQAFLTVCNVQDNPVKRFTWQESEAVFDFTRLTFMFATTELDQLFGPFKDRLTQIDFQEYSKEELGRIVSLKCYTPIADKVLPAIVDTTRGNARSAVKRAMEINLFCSQRKVKVFGEKHWAELCFMLGIKPLGLSNTEVQLLGVLRERGNCSLQMLASATGLSRKAIQREAEVHLLKFGLMKIDGQRKLTGYGEKILTQLDK